MGAKTYVALAVGMYFGSVVSAALAAKRTKDKPFVETWREYVPSAILFTAGSLVLVIVVRGNEQQVLALSKSYDLVKTAYDSMRDNLPPKVLTAAEQKTLERDVNDRFNVPQNALVLVPPTVYCFDHLTGQSFTSSVEKIHKACQALNYTVIHDGFATMNDYCDELGLEYTQSGNLIGWDSGPITFTISTKLKDETVPVVVISVSPLPSAM